MCGRCAVVGHHVRGMGYPLVTKLKGSFDNLVDFLVSSAGRVEPLIEGHDPLLWQRWR
jgi:hypothetical protein